MQLRSASFPVFGLISLLFTGLYTQTTSADASQLERGEAIYLSLCIYCHGPKGEGDGPAAALNGVPMGDLSDRAYMSQLSTQEVREIVTYGWEKFPYIQMPPWKDQLSPGEIRAVVAFVRTLAIDKGPLKGPGPHEREKRFNSDPLERGRVYYLKYCFLCHGEKGDGDGPSARSVLSRVAVLSDPNVNRRLTKESMIDYVTGRRGVGTSRYMPVFDPIIKDKVDEIYLYVKTLTKRNR